MARMNKAGLRERRQRYCHYSSNRARYPYLTLYKCHNALYQASPAGLLSQASREFTALTIYAAAGVRRGH